MSNSEAADEVGQASSLSLRASSPRIPVDDEARHIVVSRGQDARSGRLEACPTCWPRSTPARACAMLPTEP